MLTARCANLTYISIHCTESSYGKNSLHWADIWQEVIATRQDTQFWLHLQLDNVYYINSLHCWGQSKWDWFWRFWTKDWLNDISKKEEKYNHVQRRRSPCSRIFELELCLCTFSYISNIFQKKSLPTQAISVFKNIRMGAVSLHIARRQHVAFGKRYIEKKSKQNKKVWIFCFLGNVRILLGICTKCNSF